MDLDPVDGCGESSLRVLLVLGHLPIFRFRSHSDSTKKGQSAECCRNRPVPLYFQKEATKRNVCKSFFLLGKLLVQGSIRANLCDAFFFTTITGMVRSVIGMSFIL